MREDAEEGATLVLYGVALGLLIATVALRAYQHGRVRGAEEVSDLIASYARGRRDQRQHAPHVEREAPGER